MTLANKTLHSPRSHRDLAIAAAAVLTPLGHLVYLSAIEVLRGDPLHLDTDPFSLLSLSLYLVALALTGVIVYLGWRWGLRVAPVFAVTALLIWPFEIHAGLGHDLFASLPFVITLIVTALEGFLRFPERMRQFTTGPTGRYALAVGLLHFVLGSACRCTSGGSSGWTRPAMAPSSWRSRTSTRASASWRPARSR